jgi:MFS family permease
MLGMGIMAPLLPLYVESLGIGGLWLGVIFGIFSLSRSLITPLFGRISDRRGRKLIIQAGLLGYTLISLAYIWAQTAPLLAIVRIVHGVASAMVLPVAQAYVGDLSPKGEEGRWMGVFSASFVAGWGIGPLMGGVLADSFGANAAFYGMGIFNLIALIGATLFLPRREPERVIVSQSGSLNTLTANPMARGLSLLMFIYYFATAATIAFFPILVTRTGGHSASVVGMLIGVQVLMATVVQLNGRMADRFNRRRLTIIGGLMVAVQTALLPLSGDLWYLVALNIIAGVGSAVSSVSSNALMVEEGRKYGMGSTVSLYNMVGGIAMAAGPVAGGVITEVIGVNAAFYFGAVVALLGVAAFAIATRR